MIMTIVLDDVRGQEIDIEMIAEWAPEIET